MIGYQCRVNTNDTSLAIPSTLIHTKFRPLAGAFFAWLRGKRGEALRNHCQRSDIAVKIVAYTAQLTPELVDGVSIRFQCLC